MSIVGTRILMARKHLGLTQQELAVKMGYKTKSAINKIETGIRDVSQSKIVQFANVLETSPAYLMGWTDNYNNIEKDPPQLSDGEQKLIELFRQVPKEQQELVLSMINGAIESLNSN